MRLAAFIIFAGACAVAVLEGAGVIEPLGWLIWPVCVLLLAYVVYLDRQLRR